MKKTKQNKRKQKFLKKKKKKEGKGKTKSGGASGARIYRGSEETIHVSRGVGPAVHAVCGGYSSRWVGPDLERGAAGAA